MNLTEFSVLGAGQMGSGIAQVAATELDVKTVWLADISSEALQRAKLGIEKSLSKLVEKNLLTADRRNVALGRLRFTSSFDDLKGVDFLVEAITEHEPTKTSVLCELGKVLKPSAVMASNTSSIPITRLAKASGRATQFVGMHFMNPVPLMKLVEVIPGMATSAEVTKWTHELAKEMGKVTVESKDMPGFIINRILMPMINEAFKTLSEGIASPEAIDNGMKLGTNQPMGPLTLADFIGLDTCLAIMQVLQQGLGSDRYAPSPLLKTYVDAGFLGRKTGRGVYQYAIG